MGFDEFGAHLVGEERVLVIGAIVLAGCEDGDNGIVVEVGGRDGNEGFQQALGIGIDRSDAVFGEQLWEELHHGFAIFQHVGDAGGCARVVLEDIEFILAGADNVDADDVAVDPQRGRDAHHLGHEGGVIDDQFFRDAAGL